jgi:hypothetical protein
MAQPVDYTAAIASKMVLESKFNKKSFLFLN